jgi:hypothetical protein
MDIRGKCIKNENCNFKKRSSNLDVNPVFTFNGENINIEDEFTYLGTVFMSNDSFCKTRLS